MLINKNISHAGDGWDEGGVGMRVGCGGLGCDCALACMHAAHALACMHDARAHAHMHAARACARLHACCACVHCVSGQNLARIKPIPTRPSQAQPCSTKTKHYLGKTRTHRPEIKSNKLYGKHARIDLR